MARLEDSIQKLDDLAGQLNASADRINRLLSETEERLRETSAGIEEWIPLSNGLLFGWSRLGKAFGLAIYDQDPNGGPMPIRNASRRVRILAAHKLEALIHAIISKAETMLADFEGTFELDKRDSVSATEYTEIQPTVPDQDGEVPF